MIDFSGVYTAIITPFNSNGVIDYGVFKQQIEKQIEGGVNGIVVNSTTGEGFSLSEKDKQKNANFAQKQIKKRVKLIICVGEANIANTINSLNSFERYRPDAFLLNLPYFVKPNFSGLLKYVATCAKATSVPIVLYYVPKRSGQSLLTFQLIFLLNCHPNIVGIKFASDNLAQLSELAKQKDKFVLTGEDTLFEESLKLGAVGAISVISNAFPKIVSNFVKKYNHHNDVDYLNFQNIKPIIKDLFLETNPVGIKHLLNLMSANVGVPRLPLCEAGQELKDKLKEDLFKLKQQKLI